MFRWTRKLISFALGAFCTAATAQSLTIGSRAEITMDPHHQWLASNISYYRQIFGALTALDENAQAQPMLATFRLVNDTTWEFKLDPKARFHNGQPVTAADVLASLLRARDLPNAAASYKGALQTVTDMKAVDAQTLHLVTERPNSNIPQQVSQIAVVPQDIAKSATREDFVAGRAVIGAGPYRLVRY